MHRDDGQVVRDDVVQVPRKGSALLLRGHRCTSCRLSHPHPVLFSAVQHETDGVPHTPCQADEDQSQPHDAAEVR
ncbi:hypothetical protein ACFFX0_21645 [Citricoccus parietis]|uniref:Uncharacterized protein n=1 Tax=Citricoccus parietis TaxID=592307 RepID=A0ABV5G407_9MICC